MHARALLAIPVAAILAGDVLARAGGPSEALLRPAWSEVAWPFRIDQWGTGRAFRCDAAHCGAELMLYLRPKVGFCNCTTGVADDDEIDRVGDITLIDGVPTALAPGKPVTVGFMRGRTRPFQVDTRFARRHHALAVALSSSCDAVVATLDSTSDIAPAQEQAALAFLAGDGVQRWAKESTGSAVQ